jgi:hypothetical protein
MNMERRSRTQLVLGILLILIAGWLIASHLSSSLANVLRLSFAWPMWVILAGAALLVIGLLVGDPEMAVPACIVAGIGGILYYQNGSGDWASWSYMWTLVPGFGGIGMILAGVLGEEIKPALRNGMNAVLGSLVLFVIFASIFHAWAIFGRYNLYVPIVLLFALGIWFIVRGVVRRR